jgi:hypothetical protein
MGWIVISGKSRSNGQDQWKGIMLRFVPFCSYLQMPLMVVKVKVPRNRPEGPEGEYKYSFTLS